MYVGGRLQRLNLPSAGVFASVDARHAELRARCGPGTRTIASNSREDDELWTTRRKLKWLKAREQYQIDCELENDARQSSARPRTRAHLPPGPPRPRPGSRHRRLRESIVPPVHSKSPPRTAYRPSRCLHGVSQSVGGRQAFAPTHPPLPLPPRVLRRRPRRAFRSPSIARTNLPSLLSPPSSPPSPHLFFCRPPSRTLFPKVSLFSPSPHTPPFHNV